MEQYLNNFKNCLQKEIPYCAAECPFQFDILDFIEKMKRGGFKAAFKTYRNAVGFPLIAARLCPEPCKSVCPRKETDRHIDLKLLERAAIAYAKDRKPTDYNLPLKKRKIAIVGAGISGLACALRLATKKYEVEVFEAGDRKGGCLWELMPSEDFLKDIDEQFQYEACIWHFGRKIQSAEELEEFDAVYVATGEGGMDFGLLAAENELGDKYCAKYGDAGWFAGGGLVGDAPVYALANGLFMGTVIDNFLKTATLRYPKNQQNTGMCLNPVKLRYEEPVEPGGVSELFIGSADGRGTAVFSEEEAKREAGRCMECQCDSCRIYCDLTDFYNKWPLRIRDEIMATTLPGSAEVKATPAKRLMSTCNQCGLCKETCPQEIDLGGLILAGRRSMHRQKKAPWVFHDFWLRDMDFANGERCSIARAPKGKERCNYAFFPGCQLSASEPGLTEAVYGYLCGKLQDLGLLLRCCGVPAEWSGDAEKHRSELAVLKEEWEKLGQPTLILACPTCEKTFKAHLPEIPVKSLYQILAELEIPAGKGAEAAYSVFDPCASRREEETKKAVRLLAEKSGYRLEPMPENDTFARCCSYGGQPAVANPEYARFVTNKRITESDNPYITYCINCRDIFLEAGKEAVHILDILFGDCSPSRKTATVSQRRDNRVLLAQRLRKQYWSEEMEDKRTDYGRVVHIPQELAEKLHKDRILEENIVTVIDFCERNNRRVFKKETGTYSGYREVGFMTCWVEYMPREDGSFTLINAYCHRMKIELEAVWNGVKQDLDLR